jgi:hypothetical protein
MVSPSDYRKRAQDWIGVTERLPPEQRPSALKIAEAWLELAMDAETAEMRQLQEPSLNSRLH